MINENETSRKAQGQREAAAGAVALLVERLGPDLKRFVEMHDKASFRFRPALTAALTTEVP